MEICEHAPGQRVPELKLGSFESRAQTSFGFRIPMEMEARLRKLGHPDLAIDLGIFERLVLMLDQTFSLLGILGFQAFAGTALLVLAVKHAVPVAQLHDQISLFHVY